MNKKYLIGLVLLALVRLSQADNSLGNLVGVVPGNVSTIPLASTSVPFTMERIPTTNKALAQVFPDLQIFMLVPENIISAVSGRRAMRSISACAEQRKEVLAIIQSIFSRPYKGTSHEWELQATSGEYVAAVRCTRSGGNPYPLLEMHIAHPPTYDKHQSRLRAY